MNLREGPWKIKEVSGKEMSGDDKWLMGYSILAHVPSLDRELNNMTSATKGAV